MDFTFPVWKLFGSENRLSKWTKRDVEALAAKSPEKARWLRQVLDSFGEGSAIAQKLPAPITSYSKLLNSRDEWIYMYHDTEAVCGLLKMGRRTLFYFDETGNRELKPTPLCCLDFYVHESCQRQGIGTALLEYALADLGIQARNVAYDRPSPKLLSFLKRHYKLTNYIPQSNNFVIFREYFHAPESPNYNSTYSILTPSRVQRQASPSRMHSIATPGRYNSPATGVPASPGSPHGLVKSPLQDSNTDEQSGRSARMYDIISHTPIVRHTRSPRSERGSKLSIKTPSQTLADGAVAEIAGDAYAGASAEDMGAAPVARMLDMERPGPSTPVRTELHNETNELARLRESIAVRQQRIEELQRTSNAPRHPTNMSFRTMLG